jgi:hypothetical protein
VQTINDTVLKRAEMVLSGMYWRDMRQRLQIKLKTEEAERSMHVCLCTRVLHEHMDTLQNMTFHTRPSAVEESLAHLHCERFEVAFNMMGLAIGSSAPSLRLRR